MHVFLPHLEAFRFALVGHDNDLPLFGAVVHFLRARPRLRRLDLGVFPWELVRGLLPELPGLRALRVRIESLTSLAVDALVRALPREMQAIHLACASSDRLMVRPRRRSPFSSPSNSGSATTARVRACVFALRRTQHAPLARFVVPSPTAAPSHAAFASLHGRLRRRAGRAEPRLCRVAWRALRSRPFSPPGQLRSARCVGLGWRTRRGLRRTEGASRPPSS